MIDQLRQKIGEAVRENEPLSKHTNFRIGGPARYFFEARSSDELVNAVRGASELGLPFFILGGGSNVLVSDDGFQGLVIKTANRKVIVTPNQSSLHSDGTGQAETGTVFAEAGVLSAFLARKTAEAGLTGFEWAISLPGTIGGAVRGNAGCFGGEMRDVVKRVQILQMASDEWQMATFSRVDCGFGYRDSVFKHFDPPSVILSVELELKKDDSKLCLVRLGEKLAMRREKQPLESSSAGCLFKNFEFENEQEIAKLKAQIEIPKEFLAAKRIPAAWIIDQLDFKGKRIGDAQVSEKHANFILNRGAATAGDVIQLVSMIKTKARNELDIHLHEEVQYVGF